MRGLALAITSASVGAIAALAAWIYLVPLDRDPACIDTFRHLVSR